MKMSKRVIDFIETLCFVPDGVHVGKPLKLAPFQKKFIREVYDNPHGTRRAYLSIGRKNGKSGLIACLLLAHLAGPVARPNSQIISGARSRDQAALVFDLARKMVEMSGTLSGIIRVVPSGKRLIGLNQNVEYKAISAEGKTAYGLSPVLAILDEVGQVVGSNDDFVNAITTSQGAHESPLLIAISTQAPTDADLFSIWLDDAKNSDDKRIVSHVYTADPDAALMDEKAWKAANPALKIFRSYDDMKEQAERAVRMPTTEASFRNLCLNQRISIVSPFVAPSVWQSCGADPTGFGDYPVWCGLDLSSRTDLTAFVVIWEVGTVWQVKPFFWTPEIGLNDRAKRDRSPYDVWAKSGHLITTPGATVDYEWVAANIAEILSPCEVLGIAFDRWRIDVFKKELDRIGLELPLVPFGQGFKDMAPAIDAMEEALLNSRIAHGMHPVLAMCAVNAMIVRDPAGNRKLDKAKAVGRIDGLVALTMAMGMACSQTEDKPSTDWETRKVIVF